MTRSVLIVGLGQIGIGYDLDLDPCAHVYSHARAFQVHPAFELIGGVDPDAGKRETFSRSYGCPAFGELAEALRQRRPDIVVLAMPTSLHAEALQEVLALSQPHAILCEKPLSYTMDEAEMMVNTCAARHIKLYVNYMRRSDVGVVEVRRRLDVGDIAAPIKGVAWYSKGFLHNGSHIFNLLEYWLGPMHDFLTLDSGRRWGEADQEPDVQVRFERGTVVFLAAWEEAFSHYTVELLSQSGRLRYEQGGKFIQWQPLQADKFFQGYTVLGNPQVLASGMERSQLQVTEQLARALEGRDAHLCSGMEALHTLNSMTRVLEGPLL
jgi:predicted dehydrogenase